MDWIKKHTDQFSLALMGLVLIALSVLLVLKAQGFEEGFSAAMISPTRSKEVPKLDLSPLETAQKQFSSPPKWTQKSGEKSLFTSIKLIEENGALVKAIVGDVVSGNRKMSKDWLLKYELNILSSAVFDEDPDKDGFTNYDEYVGADLIGDDGGKDSTDPNNKESHPPYYTKLFLKQWIKIPFLVTFQSYDGDPSKPNEMTFQINAISRASKTEFLELGKKVANSTFVLEKFEKKEKLNNEVMDDVSELTIRNTETNEPIILVLGKRTDSPDSYGSFLYYWPEVAKPQEIKPKKLQEFVLKPNVQERYKLIDIKEDGAVIQLPGGDKTYSVPLVKKALELQKQP